jgi:hypothetical protein
VGLACTTLLVVVVVITLRLFSTTEIESCCYSCLSCAAVRLPVQ